MRTLMVDPFPSLRTPQTSHQGHSPFWKPRSGPPGRSHDQTIALILAGEIHYPRSMGAAAKDFISKLLNPSPGSRLGCARVAPKSPASTAEGDVSSSRTTSSQKDGKVGGWQAVKHHDFFKDMDWEGLLRGELASPIKPGSLGRSLVSNFSREYTRQRVCWGGDQQELRDVGDKDFLFKRELIGFDFVRD